MANILILGAGSMGTAFSFPCSENNHVVSIIGTHLENDFIDQMNTKQFKDVQNFFDTMPKLKHTVQVKNPKTKKTSEVILSGLNDFFS